MKAKWQNAYRIWSLEGNVTWKTLDNVKRKELDYNFHYKIFLPERAHGTAHNISNINVILTSLARGENLTDKHGRFETYIHE